MGQKASTPEEPHNILLRQYDSPELSLKPKNCNKLIDKKIDSIITQDIKDGKPAIPNADVLINHAGDNEKISEEKSNLFGKLMDECINDDNNIGERYLTKTCLNPDFLPLLDNPSVAELSQFTALKMMQNFEEFAKLEQFWKSQVREIDEKIIDDNVSEKDFRFINYEDLPAVQLDDNEMPSKQDSSTTTNEIKDFSRDTVEDDITTQEKLYKETKELTSDCSILNDVANTLEVKKEEEVLQLRMRVNKLKCERDEAMMKMRFAEERFQASEAELKCLEAILGNMEDKLRIIVSELSEEVKKSKSLEQQLSQSLRESSLNSSHTESFASIE